MKLMQTYNIALLYMLKKCRKFDKICLKGLVFEMDHIFILTLIGSGLIGSSVITPPKVPSCP